MNENYQILRDKRHRSSSSLIGNIVDSTFSDRTLHIRGSIPEVEDHFEVAENRCDDLKLQLDLVKAMRKQKTKKLKRRSATRIVSMQHASEQTPHHILQSNNEDDERDPGYISVQTKPKKKSLLTQSRMIRASETMRSKNPSRSYIDRTNEQHSTFSRGYDQTYTEEYIKILQNTPQELSHVISRGQSMEQRRVRSKRTNRTDPAPIQHHQTDAPEMMQRDDTVRRDRKPQKRPPWNASGLQNVEPTDQLQEDAAYRNRQPYKEERPVVELFNKKNAVRTQRANRSNRDVATRTPEIALNNRFESSERVEAVEVGPDKTPSNNIKQQLLARNSKTSSNMESIIQKSHNKMAYRERIRRRHNSRGYELPTVASRMKQTGRNHYMISNHTSIPFIVSKSTTPSHNIGVNIQQVLNGMKMQQPISNIPLTIAHHMGLRHTPTWGPTRQVRSAPLGTPQQSSLEKHDINLIKMGRRLLRLPSYKYISYSKLLNLYKEGEGMVPRFLRAMTKPNYFYQNAFNVAARGDIGGLPKALSRQEMKQSLAEYASIYREYQNLSQQAKTGNNLEVEGRLEELSRELAAREQHIRQVVTAYNEVSPAAGTSTGVRMSASTLGGVECARSVYRLNAASEV